MAWSLWPILIALNGCASGGETTPSNIDYTKLRSMTSFYEAYLSEHKGQPPADEMEFRTWLEAKQERLQQAQLTMSDMFRSPRSGEPLEWVFGKARPAGTAGVTYVAYEKTPT